MVKNGCFPSGKALEDLYSFLQQEWKTKYSNEKWFISFVGFILFSKYNEKGVNRVNILIHNDTYLDSIIDRN